MFSSTEYNSTLFESHLLIYFSNKNPLTLLAELIRAGPMIVNICSLWCKLSILSNGIYQHFVGKIHHKYWNAMSTSSDR
jgi:hypothetical protein